MNILSSSRATDSIGRIPTEQGRLSKALTRLWMKRGTVVANEHLADRVRLITLEGVAFQGGAWTAGQKVQIAMGSAFIMRTYTPIEWNPSAGRMRIVGYAHGDGPGSAWVRAAKPGDECSIFGPRASLDVRRLPAPLVIVGDETAFGHACAANRQERPRLITSVFEVEDVESARHIASHLGIQNVMLFARSRGDAHIVAMQAALSAKVETGHSFLLIGKAPTIQRLRQGLMQQGVPAARVVTKAYWAPGKTGLTARVASSNGPYPDSCLKPAERLAVSNMPLASSIVLRWRNGDAGWMDGHCLRVNRDDLSRCSIPRWLFLSSTSLMFGRSSSSRHFWHRDRRQRARCHGRALCGCGGSSILGTAGPAHHDLCR